MCDRRARYIVPRRRQESCGLGNTLAFLEKSAHVI